MKYLFQILIISIIALFGCKNETDYLLEKDDSKIYSSFEKIESSHSNIDFINKITPSFDNKANLFDYDYFYNGSGVGVADFNNDGLKDIILTANQTKNKIYINKGELIFEDITLDANINENKRWSSGVAIADVNNDGWMDIYISQGGPNSANDRKNLLYINQKDLTFKEQAKEYGLADEGISTQSAFFDFDKDGDLDCLVMNENSYFGVDPLQFYTILKDKEKLKLNSSQLYEQVNGKFINITEKSGLLKPSFGLGLCISDINNDNWLDIYIANDYYVPDAMYINNKDGTFSDKIKQNTKQVSFFGMGVDIADVNNDNLKDIFVLDMASSDHIRSKTLMASMSISNFELLTKKLNLPYQYMFNSLQLNIGSSKFHNIAQVSGLSNTDWSWAGLIFDYNNDSNEDIYITNGYRKYASDNDSRIRINNIKRKFNNKVPLKIKEELYNMLPSEKLANILYENDGTLKFKDVTSYSDLNQPSFSNGAAYSDLDNDGDLDLIINNIDQEAFLFKNNSIENNKGNFLKIKLNGVLSENFAKVTISYDGNYKTKESKRVRGYLSSVDEDIHFGLGKKNSVDSVEVLWNSGKSEVKFLKNINQTIVFNENDAKDTTKLYDEKTKVFEQTNAIDYNHKENYFNDFEKEILLPYKQSTLGPFMTKGDINGDSLMDIYIGGSKGTSGRIYLNTGENLIYKPIKVFLNDSNYEDMESLFIDIDLDGDKDLFVVSGGSEFNERSTDLIDRLYINDGNGNFSKSRQDDLNNYTISGKSISKIDYDKDGDYDIIVGNRIKPQKYPLHEPSIIYENDNGILNNVSNKIAPELEDFGIVNKIITTDFDNDGWEDFIVVGEWTHIGIFKNNEGVFTDISERSDLNNLFGWWFNIQETDINNDGLKDYVVGNIGSNIKFKTSSEKPLRIYADDFDNNGTHDLVLSYEYENKYVPLRGKECSTQQMPFIAEKIPTFTEFANSSLQDIYGDKINTSYMREVTDLNSYILINNGDSTFKRVKLPDLAQTIPILSSDVFDYNKDGYEDVIISGNIYNTEVETPRLDNPFALVLLSNKKNGYQCLSPNATGLYTIGNTKSVRVLNDPKVLIIGNNSESIESFLINN
ncbi:MAG: VCBS repeat-containing protein [Flavobacteriaceae bacterium]|nr:VCBS repeat-containing protein [Flavobacteriaceae bacterium]